MKHVSLRTAFMNGQSKAKREVSNVLDTVIPQPKQPFEGVQEMGPSRLRELDESLFDTNYEPAPKNSEWAPDREMGHLFNKDEKGNIDFSSFNDCLEMLKRDAKGEPTGMRPKELVRCQMMAKETFNFLMDNNAIDFNTLEPTPNAFEKLMNDPSKFQEFNERLGKAGIKLDENGIACFSDGAYPRAKDGSIKLLDKPDMDICTFDSNGGARINVNMSEWEDAMTDSRTSETEKLRLATGVNVIKELVHSKEFIEGKLHLDIHDLLNSTSSDEEIMETINERLSQPGAADYMKNIFEAKGLSCNKQGVCIEDSQYNGLADKLTAERSKSYAKELDKHFGSIGVSADNTLSFNGPQMN